MDEAPHFGKDGDGQFDFDLQDALDRCFDRVMFEQMREFFFEQSAETLKELHRATALGESKAIAHAAHAFKGTVAYLGSQSCLKAVQTLEQAGEDGDLKTAAQRIEHLAKQVEHLKKALLLGRDAVSLELGHGEGAVPMRKRAEQLDRLDRDSV
jgi:HPt (histidine-containing phosphotransfer) domain-containing protein